MVVNYVEEQIALGPIQARKIYGKLNNADLHTKPLRCPSYTTMAHRILGQPSTSSADTEPPTVEDSGLSPDLHVGTKHLLPATPPSSEGAKRRKAHALQYVTHTAPLSKSDDKPMDSVPASASILITTSDANSVL